MFPFLSLKDLDSRPSSTFGYASGELQVMSKRSFAFSFSLVCLSADVPLQIDHVLGQNKQERWDTNKTPYAQPICTTSQYTKLAEGVFRQQTLHLTASLHVELNCVSALLTLSLNVHHQLFRRLPEGYL